jgi:hypothetical protein
VDKRLLYVAIVVFCAIYEGILTINYLKHVIKMQFNCFSGTFLVFFMHLFLSSVIFLFDTDSNGNAPPCVSQSELGGNQCKSAAREVCKAQTIYVGGLGSHPGLLLDRSLSNTLSLNTVNLSNDLNIFVPP